MNKKQSMKAFSFHLSQPSHVGFLSSSGGIAGGQAPSAPFSIGSGSGEHGWQHGNGNRCSRSGTGRTTRCSGFGRRSLTSDSQPSMDTVVRWTAGQTAELHSFGPNLGHDNCPPHGAGASPTYRR